MVPFIDLVKQNLGALSVYKYQEREIKKCAITLIAMIFFTFLSGCDKRPIIQSDNLEFSVGNVTIGTEKYKAKELTDLSYCNQKKENLVECFSTLKNHRIQFLSNPIVNITYQLFDESSRIGGMDFSVSGQNISRHSIENKWTTLKGRCINGFDAEDIQRYSEDGSISVRQIKDWGIYLRYSDFVCLSENGKFISVEDSHDKKSQRVEIYFLADIPSRFLSRAISILAEKKRKDSALK